MRKHEKNKIQVYSKINHVHFCAVYLKANDIGNFIRHYLFLRINFAGEYRSLETLRADINALTGWDPKAITNAITRLKNDGEIEQKKSLYRLHPKVANRFGFCYRSKYEGKDPVYNERQQKLIDTLEEQIRHTRHELPANDREFDEWQSAEDIEAEDMVALMKIERLEQTVKEQNDRLQHQNETLQQQSDVLKKLEDLLKEVLVLVGPDVQAQAKQKLASVLPFRLQK